MKKLLLSMVVTATFGFNACKSTGTYSETAYHNGTLSIHEIITCQLSNSAAEYNYDTVDKTLTIGSNGEVSKTFENASLADIGGGTERIKWDNDNFLEIELTFEGALEGHNGSYPYSAVGTSGARGACYSTSMPVTPGN